jgi:hypothetical protein
MTAPGRLSGQRYGDRRRDGRRERGAARAGQVAQNTQQNAHQLPRQYQQYLAAVNAAARAHDVDPAVLLGVMSRETGARTSSATTATGTA